MQTGVSGKVQMRVPTFLPPVHGPLNGFLDALLRTEVGVDRKIAAKFTRAHFEEGHVALECDGEGTDGMPLAVGKKCEIGCFGSIDCIGSVFLPVVE